MWVIGSSLRQVIVVPTGTVVVEGLNISELRLMTGPAGADVVAIGAVADDSACALQPARAAGGDEQRSCADEESAAYRLIPCNIHASYSAWCNTGMGAFLQLCPEHK